MKKKILLILLVLASLFILASCQKECKHESISFDQTIKNPSCMSVGKERYVCDDCGEYLTYDIEKLEHIEDTGTVTTPATCTTEGQMTYSCIREECNEILRVEKIDVIPHTKGEWKVMVEETCSEDGYKALLCSGCDYVFEEEAIPAHHVEEILNSKESTCSEVGLTEGVKCSVCDEILVAQEAIPMKPHTLIEAPYVDPTCSSFGYTKGEKCANCNYWSIKQNEIPMLPHTVVTDNAVAATCTELGLTEGSHCSVCNTVVVKQDKIPALGHDFDFYNNTCTRCSEKEYAEIRSRNDLISYENTSYDAVIYLDYCINVSATNEYWTLTIGPETQYIRLIGTAGVEYNFRLVIDNARTTTLKIDLIDTTLKTLVNYPIIESTSTTKLELGLYGTRSVILGKDGSNGSNASLGASYNGGNASNGNNAIKISGDLVINMGASYAKISGGNGGNGGRGLNAAPSPQDGGKGGNGGNGGMAIVANSITINGVNGCSSNSIIITGGSGGSGGSGGDGFLWGKKGKDGSSGSSSAAASTTITYK